MRAQHAIILTGVMIIGISILLMAKAESVTQIFYGQSKIPTCADGVRNQDETDIDCGGSCGFCASGQQCLSDGDCGFHAACDTTECRSLEWHANGCLPLLKGHADANAENLNVVFAGIGYADQDMFLKDARRAVQEDIAQISPGLLAYEPIFSSRDRINLWYIESMGKIISDAGDCRERCTSHLGAEYCNLPNRQVIYLCDTTCALSAEKGGDLYVGKSAQQPFEVVHGFGHSYGFLDDAGDDSLMGEYLRVEGKQRTGEDFSPEARAQIAERLNRHRGKQYDPWYMLWIVFDEQFNIVAARENPSSIGETRRLAAPYILRMNAGALSYVFDFDARRTIVTEDQEPQHVVQKYFEVPLPLKISRLSDDKLQLVGYKGTAEPYTLDIMGPSGELVRRIPAEELAKFLR